MEQNNKNIIIIDLLRTLYDPEENILIKGVKETLDELSKNNTLLLVSRDEGQRKKILKDLGIEHYFKEVFLLPEKTEREFSQIIQKYKEGSQTTYVIGDRIQDEIYIGNRLGCKTIWVRHGKFKNILPNSIAEKPWRSVPNISDIVNHIIN